MWVFAAAKAAVAGFTRSLAAELARYNITANCGLEMSPGIEAACRAVFGTWGFFRTMHGKTAPSCGLHSQGGVRRGVRASGSYQEGTGKSGSYGMWNHPRGHVWNVFVRPASS